MAETNADNQEKWKGTFRERVGGITADEVWPFLEDFCNVHKVLPFVDKSWKFEGEDGKPGLIRYCVVAASFLPPSSGELFWLKEKLLMIDSDERCLSYQMIENTIGINGYVATIKVEDDDEGCCVEWSVVVDPIQGKTFQDFEADWNSFLHSMVQRILSLLSPVNGV